MFLRAVSEGPTQCSWTGKPWFHHGSFSSWLKSFDLSKTIKSSTCAFLYVNLNYVQIQAIQISINMEGKSCTFAYCSCSLLFWLEVQQWLLNRWSFKINPRFVMCLWRMVMDLFEDSLRNQVGSLGRTWCRDLQQCFFAFNFHQHSKSYRHTATASWFLISKKSCCMVNPVDPGGTPTVETQFFDTQGVNMGKSNC